MVTVLATVKSRVVLAKHLTYHKTFSCYIGTHLILFVHLSETLGLGLCVQYSFSVPQPLVYIQLPLLNSMLWMVCLWEQSVLSLLGFYTEFKVEF